MNTIQLRKNLSSKIGWKNILTGLALTGLGWFTWKKYGTKMTKLRKA